MFIEHLCVVCHHLLSRYSLSLSDSALTKSPKGEEIEEQRNYVISNYLIYQNLQSY